MERELSKKYNGRIDFLDLAKGIGVILVVLGHMPSVVPENIRMWIFSFHMPLFFFISGFCAKTFDKKRMLINAIAQKTRKLLVGGYLGFGFIFLFLDVLLFKMGFTQIKQSVIALLLGIIDKVYWFFLSLLIVSVIFLLLTYMIKSVSIQMIICVLIVVLGSFCKQVDFNYYRLGSSFYSFGFYYIAYIIRRNYELDHEITNIKRLLVAIVGSVGGSLIILRKWDSVLDINHNYHHDIVINYLIAFCGIYIVIVLSLFLNQVRTQLVIKEIKNIGRNSFFFFPILDYMPGALSAVCKSGSILIKVLAYLLGICSAHFLSEVIRHVKLGIGKE